MRCDGILEERVDALKVFCMLYKIVLRLIFFNHVSACGYVHMYEGILQSTRGIRFPWSWSCSQL